MKVAISVLIIVGLLFTAGVVFATEIDQVLSEPNSGSTEGTSWGTPSSSLNNFLNQYAKHTHGIPARENPLGLGLDLEYAFSKTYSTALEYRYDFANEEHSTYLVAKIKFGKK